MGQVTLTCRQQWTFVSMLLCDVIGLPGTQKRVAVDAPPYQSQQFNGAWGLSWGFRRGAYESNRSAGVSLLFFVSLVQTRTLATGMLPATPLERTLRCSSGKKTASDTYVSLFSTWLPSHPEGVKLHLGGRRWMLCTNGLMSLPTRCMPILMLDLNDRLGRPRATMKGTTIWKERMKTTLAHCLMRMDGNVVNVGHERHTEGRTHGEPKVVASLVVTNQCFWCGSTHASKETTSKHMAAAERHNRCVVNAGRFHYPVIDIPPDTTAELQRHLASMEYPLPDSHSIVINAETSIGACGSDLWQKIRDRWRARRAERETKTHQTTTWRDEGRRGDGRHELGAEGIRQGRPQEHGREATQRRPQDALRTLSASAGSQRRSLHVLDDQARGARVQEAAQWERPMRLEWQTSSKRGTIWNRRELSIWYLIASRPKCTTQL